MPQTESTQNWLPAVILVVALHFAAWWGLTHFRDDIERPRPLEEINVALLAPPPPEPPRIEPPPPPRVPVPPQAKAPPPLQPPPQPVVQPMLSTTAADAPLMAAPPATEAPRPSAAPGPSAAPQVVSRPAPEAPLEPPGFHANYLNNPPPAYPFAARRRGIEGNVLVRAEISTEGKCLRVELVKSSGADMLDQAALEAVKAWRFVPARRGAQAVVAWVDVPLAFKLEN